MNADINELSSEEEDEGKCDVSQSMIKVSKYDKREGEEKEFNFVGKQPERMTGGRRGV